MKKCLALLLFFLFVGGAKSYAQVAITGSTAYEGSHTFSATQLWAFCVGWHTQAARWLMIFDGTLPANGAVAPKWCQGLTSSSTPADQFQCFDWTSHYATFTSGSITIALSTNASGCTSLTVDGANDWINAQVK